MDNGRNRFFEWNYDEGIVLAYERLGECNGCGDCCRAEIWLNVAGELTPGNTPWEERGNGGPDTTGQGIWNEVRIGDVRRFFLVRNAAPGNLHCAQLTEDNRCKIHLTKPLFDKAWPMSPRHIVPMPRCSYTFRELARWSLEALKEATDRHAT
jgi:Fe-S-cluster containining protein